MILRFMARALRHDASPFDSYKTRKGALFASSFAATFGFGMFLYLCRPEITLLDDSKRNDNEMDGDKPFDISSEIENRASEFWRRVNGEVTDEGKESETVSEEPTSDLWGLFPTSVEARTDSKEKISSKADSKGLSEMATGFLGVLAGRSKEDYIQDIIRKTQQSQRDGDLEEPNSLPAVIDMFSMYSTTLEQVADKYLGNIDFTQPVPPTALLYYLEREDEVKNPSWKRRMHRYFRGIDIDQFQYLNQALELAELSYADSVQEIRDGLSRLKEPYELIYAEVNSAPGKPAHFLAIKRDQSILSPALEVLIGVRGTKTAADALTDLLCDEVDYKGGKAHSFIVQSGQYISKKHLGTLEELLERSGKYKIKLTVVGHSLGGGAASIAGIEFDEHPKLDVRVVGFGTPALLSTELAQSYPYILTVVNDCDVVPRLSGVTLANAMLNVREFDWVPYAERDLNHAVDELGRLQPSLFSKSIVDRLKQKSGPLLRDLTSENISDKTPRVTPVLYPPGRCVHLYRDGVGVSGSFVPNDFFSEIDITRTLIDDHLFHSGYKKMFLELLRYHTDDHHFRFDEGQPRS